MSGNLVTIMMEGQKPGIESRLGEIIFGKKYPIQSLMGSMVGLYTAAVLLHSLLGAFCEPFFGIYSML